MGESTKLSKAQRIALAGEPARPSKMVAVLIMTLSFDKLCGQARWANRRLQSFANTFTIGFISKNMFRSNLHDAFQESLQHSSVFCQLVWKSIEFKRDLFTSNCIQNCNFGISLRTPKTRDRADANQNKCSSCLGNRILAEINQAPLENLSFVADCFFLLVIKSSMQYSDLCF